MTLPTALHDEGIKHKAKDSVAAPGLARENTRRSERQIRGLKPQGMHTDTQMLAASKSTGDTVRLCACTLRFPSFVFCRVWREREREMETLAANLALPGPLCAAL